MELTLDLRLELASEQPLTPGEILMAKHGDWQEQAQVRRLVMDRLDICWADADAMIQAQVEGEPK